jgi:hypothetical protein
MMKASWFLLAGIAVSGGVLGACATGGSDTTDGLGGGTPAAHEDAGIDAGSGFVPSGDDEDASMQEPTPTPGDDAGSSPSGDDASATTDDAAAACGASTCATGCCDTSGTCQGGTTALACGTAGGACQPCGLGQTCSAGVCGTAAPPPASDAGMCANLGCIDIFDCAIFHGAQFTPCGFTQCKNLICSP